MTTPLLTKRALLLKKIEGTYNTDANPTPAANAVLVSEPEFTVDPKVLSRNYARRSISQLPHRMGRKLAGMKFSHELRGSGDPAVSPDIGLFLRTCGMSETQITDGPAQVGAVRRHALSAVGPAVAWGSADMGATSPPEPILYTIVVTKAGASGAAQVSITPDKNAVDNGYDAAQTAVTLTSGTAVELAANDNGGAITPTWTGNLVLGQRWYTYVYPVGWLYEPVSDGFESSTDYMYLDGILHKMTGSIGTFTLEATAGEFGMLNMTYMGQYIAPINSALPNGAIFEPSEPPIFENANMTIDDYSAVINKISFDMANQIVPRSDANRPDGYNGFILTDREPKGGIDPEMALVTDEDFWGKLASAKMMPLRARFGSVVGNRSWILGRGTQYTGLSYQNRDSLRVLDAGLHFPEVGGDDEVAFFFG